MRSFKEKRLQRTCSTIFQAWRWWHKIQTYKKSLLCRRSRKTQMRSPSKICCPLVTFRPHAPLTRIVTWMTTSTNTHIHCPNQTCHLLTNSSPCSPNSFWLTQLITFPPQEDKSLKRRPRKKASTSTSTSAAVNRRLYQTRNLKKAIFLKVENQQLLQADAETLVTYRINRNFREVLQGILNGVKMTVFSIIQLILEVQTFLRA